MFVITTFKRKSHLCKICAEVRGEFLISITLEVCDDIEILPLILQNPVGKRVSLNFQLRFSI